MGLFSRRHKDWPTALAAIDEWGDEGDWVFYSGSFKVDGEFYTVQGRFEHALINNRAKRFLERMERSPQLTVRYNPDDPTENEAEID
jgi:hypothetical protein